MAEPVSGQQQSSARSDTVLQPRPLETKASKNNMVGKEESGSHPLPLERKPSRNNLLTKDSKTLEKKFSRERLSKAGWAGVLSKYTTDSLHCLFYSSGWSWTMIQTI